MALAASRGKIIVFLYSVMIISMLVGTLMYIVEGPEAGFTSIPRSIYWTIVTLTTVGYGDIVPITGFGQFLSLLVMIIGYGVIAVPTGIVSAEFTMQERKKKEKEMAENNPNISICPHCDGFIHLAGIPHCYHCGEKLESEN